MEKEEFDKLISNFKKANNYAKLDELLEKQIIFYYSQLLKNSGINFVFRNRQMMLGEVENNLSKAHIENFRRFFELSLEELSDKDLSEELEIVYENMYEEE